MSRVRIEIEFEQPGGHSLGECIMLVMNQMRAPPEWPEGQHGGTGLLNYVCYDNTLRCCAARFVDPASPPMVGE